MPDAAPHKPTAAELVERVDAARDLLGKGHPDGAVKRELAARFGCSPRSVERYLRRAREAMVRDRGLGPEVMRAQAGEFFARLAFEGDGDGVRLGAMAALAKLYGLNAPAWVAVTAPGLTEAGLELSERRYGLPVGSADAGDLDPDGAAAGDTDAGGSAAA